VKTRTHYLSFLATLAFVAVISWGSALNAQTTPSSTPADQQPAQTQQPSPDAPPVQTPQAQPTPSPDAPASAQQTPSSTAPDQAQSPSTASPNQTPDQAPAATPPAQAPTATPQASTPDASGGSQVFAGTVVKSADKYQLKDDAGKTYDIDHQDDVKKFEGKRVRVQGTLDSSGTKILVK
jgi:outer membrane biosynthesis protein TonB